MKKLVLSLSSMLLSGGLISTVAGCGAADGPTIKTLITDANSSINEDTSSSSYRGQSGFDKFKYGYADMNNNLMLPTITMMNLTDDNKRTSGAEFTSSEYENAIIGSTTKANVESAAAAVKDKWDDLWKEYSTPADTFFTQINAGVNGTAQNLALIPYYKDLLNQDYFKRAAGPGRFSILNSKANIVSFDKVRAALDFLNTNAVAPDVIEGSTKDADKNITQQARQALVSVGNFDYSVIYKGGTHTFTIPVQVSNLCARLELVDYGLAITPGKPKQLTYFQGWVFRGYDYFTPADAVNKHRVSLPSGIYSTSNLYVGFHDTSFTNPSSDPKYPLPFNNVGDFTKAATAKADTKAKDESAFPKQTSAKKGINYKDFVYSIDVDNLAEKANE